MGDMKTPDFDDLLAAFNIPDMVDPKAAIESGHQDERNEQLKHPISGEISPEDENNSSCNPYDASVSVIVKNIQNVEPSEQDETGSEKDRGFNSHLQPHSVGNGLHNGCLPTLPPHSTKNGWKTHREEGLLLTHQSSTFSQFSPISSAEEFDDEDKIEVDDSMEKQRVETFFSPRAKTEDQNPKMLVLDCAIQPKTNKDNKPDQNSRDGLVRCSNSPKFPPSPSLDDNLNMDIKSQSQGSRDADQSSGLVDLSSISQVKTKSSTKLSSCIAAIAALSAKKLDPEETVASPSPTSQTEPSQAKENPRNSDRIQEQESVSEFATKLPTKEPEIPSGATSESSSKDPPASTTDNAPVIPKVRIKTIKTSCGQIKRTVTRVLPDFDSEGLKQIETSSTCIMLSTNAIISSPTKPTFPTTVVATSGGSSIELTKQMTIKPVATAFLPVSAVKSAGSQVINLKLANNTTVKATVIPAASVQSASSAILKAANAIQQQTVMVPATSLANAKLVPKTVHLSNLNLLPQTMSSAPCEIQQAMSSSKPPQHQQPQVKQAVLTSQVSKKVTRVQVLTSSQSSVVDAFNKVLSSMNPLPVYVPNLSPPSSACISLPSRGYKCLECGDSFALEKSLTQHYERRSVRIEVTCNHCAKGLVFYNKCSLLSHARGHKDKGVVMQCSHLILKPIPADQMISTTNSATPPALSTSQTQAPTEKIQGKVIDHQTGVIAAPCNAPLVAAMPLEDDSSKLSRHSFKCSECNEMFQDDISLAVHYQQAPESSSQVCACDCETANVSRHSSCIYISSRIFL